ncbi:sigma-70 family RNA polymerase sigma factor [Actinoplanes sp. NEAU-A12]|uniref:Sigma-70 family RNA polymerase sigma factor n=1 Tax=Actinoplanes sandaracinus TaxID=3045177 RepID=A0ABT6WY81_9ACTN|nr:sigma-70 family RNA polymerase sigma factor [Actinoplanes sandaracinus]MDI6104694.1 sigma-70 family RNA polymerase sigma factor [Actinoplanes sandaracinus]
MRTLKPDPETRFRALYAGAYADVLRFAQRRVHPSHAEDVVADAFLVAWRRLDSAPADSDDARAWLFGITRNCLLNTRRGIGRQDALAVRLADVTPVAPVAAAEDEAVAWRLDLAAAWRALTPAEQETIALTVFDGLNSGQAARVLGVTATSYRLRLLRARRALRRHLGPGSPAGTLTDLGFDPATRMEARP